MYIQKKETINGQVTHHHHQSATAAATSRNASAEPMRGGRTSDTCQRNIKSRHEKQAYRTNIIPHHACRRIHNLPVDQWSPQYQWNMALQWIGLLPTVTAADWHIYQLLPQTRTPMSVVGSSELRGLLFVLVFGMASARMTHPFVRQARSTGRLLCEY